MKRARLTMVLAFLPAALVLAGPGRDWLADVPARDLQRINPFRDRSDAIEAGRLLFVDHCAQCHGLDAQGSRKRPSLRTAHVQSQATEGAIHWLLINGSTRRGMPSWSKLPDQQLWQLVSYLRSLKVLP